MTWAFLGRVSITGTDLTVSVGTVAVPASGLLEVRIKQASPVDFSPFRAGLFYLVNTSGRPLGTSKFWGHLEGEDYVLGSAGMAAEDPGTADLIIEPRSINRRILTAPIIGPWVLDVWVRSIDASGSPVSVTYNGSFVTGTGTGLTLAQVVFP